MRRDSDGKVTLSTEEARAGETSGHVRVVLIVGIVLLPRAGKIGIKVIAPALAILGALAYLRRFTSLLTGKKR